MPIRFLITLTLLISCVLTNGTPAYSIEDEASDGASETEEKTKKS